MTTKTTIPTDWKHLKLADVVTKIQGGGTPSKLEPSYWEGKIPWASVKDIVTHNPNGTLDHITELGLENSSSRLVPKGTLIVSTRMALGHAVFFNVDVAINQDLKALYPDKELGKQYLFYWFQSKKKYIARLGTGSTVDGISQDGLKNINYLLPPLPEQEKIVEVLETWDSYIEKLSGAIKLKKRVKKGLMQKLLRGKAKLPGFSFPWETKEIGELLDYEQPTNYIVQSTEYSDEYKTPVLTAGKTFVLGRTNEIIGIYNKVPVIIFDDFTTANKFVTFLFKVKSSAMKFLKAKDSNVNLKFVYEIMQIIKFPVGEHKRNYLSEYQYLSIDIPNIEEQTAIAKILTTADQEIEALEKKKTIIEQQKKYLLNNMITGKLRLPEFTK